jgi:hypothetical protein
MWNMKCMIIPVIIGATGIVTNGLRKNLEAVPGKHAVESLQQTAVLGTAHIMQEVLRSETGSLSSGDRHCFKISNREKRHLTRE